MEQIDISNEYGIQAEMQTVIGLLYERMKETPNKLIVTKITGEEKESNMPVFCKKRGHCTLALYDPISNYKKILQANRVFDSKDSDKSLGNYLDVVSYALSTGNNCLLGNFGVKDINRVSDLYGENHNGVFYMIMDHSMRMIKSIHPNAKFSLKMLEVSPKMEYFDLCTDFIKTNVNPSNLLENLVSIEINSTKLASEWIDSGYRLLTDLVSLSRRKQYVKDSMVISYFIIETEINEKSHRTTLTTIDFPDINSIDLLQNSLYLELLHSNSDRISYLTNDIRQSAFLFNVNPMLDRAAETMNTLFCAGEYGDLSEEPISYIGKVRVNEEKTNQTNDMIQKLRDHSELVKLLQIEIEREIKLKMKSTIESKVDQYIHLFTKINKIREGKEKELEMTKQSFEYGSYFIEIEKNRLRLKEKEFSDISEGSDQYQLITEKMEDLNSTVGDLTEVISNCTEDVKKYIDRYNIPIKINPVVNRNGTVTNEIFLNIKKKHRRKL